MLDAPFLRISAGVTPIGDPWDGAADVVTFSNIPAGKTLGNANAIASVWTYPPDEEDPYQINNASYVVFQVNGMTYNASELGALQVTEDMSIEVNLIFVDVTFRLSSDLPQTIGQPYIYTFLNRDVGKDFTNKMLKGTTLEDTIPYVHIGSWMGTFYQYGVPLSSSVFYFDVNGAQLSWQQLSETTIFADTLIIVHVRKITVTFTMEEALPYHFGDGVKSRAIELFCESSLTNDRIPAVFQDGGDLVVDELISYYIYNELNRESLLTVVFDSNTTIPVLVRE